MSAAALLWIALGGAIGSVARALVGFAVPAGRLPWATLIVNIAGSLLIGWLMARFVPTDEGNLRVHQFWVIGVCGGFTTFSSFSWQTLAQLQKGDLFAALANVVLSVVVCLAATWLGWRMAR
jgi:CrcB protein